MLRLTGSGWWNIKHKRWPVAGVGSRILYVSSGIIRNEREQKKRRGVSEVEIWSRNMTQTGGVRKEVMWCVWETADRKSRLKNKEDRECSGDKKRLQDWNAREISTVLNLKFNWLVGSTGLPWLEGRRDLWLVSVGVRGWDWSSGQGRETSQKKTGTQFEQNLAYQKRDKERWRE